MNHRTSPLSVVITQFQNARTVCAAYLYARSIGNFYLMRFLRRAYIETLQEKEFVRDKDTVIAV